ncbi:MAG TPA: SDR family oxidoreductase [Solirubrobacteraceae bacterium]|jgi:NADP-dependent 3-hydroxy acid dehydrogenase YdfG
MSSETLAGRRILITGGGSGIGAAVAHASVEAGARVGIIGRDEARLADVAQTTGAVIAKADITVRAEADQAVATIAKQLGGIDGLVNNAGAMLHSRISAGLSEDWETMLDVNVLGLLHVTHATLEHLRAAEHADIVNISSIAADRASLPDFAIYSATKASVLRITEALRADLGKDGDIRVSVVKPGTTKTDGFGPGIRDDRLRGQIEAVKEKTGMDPRVVAEQVCHVIAAPRALCIAEMVVIPNESWTRPG